MIDWMVRYLPIVLAAFLLTLILFPDRARADLVGTERLLAAEQGDPGRERAIVLVDRQDAAK